MRKRNPITKGLKKSKTPAEVLGLLGEALEAVSSAQKSGTAAGDAFERPFQQFAESLKNLAPRKALHILCMGQLGSFIAREVAPFKAFPTAKVRFNVFPQSEEKLAQVAQARGTKTKKEAIDTTLEFLLNRLPQDYWDRKSAVAALLSEHLPRTGQATPVSLAINSLGYALLQDLAELLGQSQGAVLEAAANMWLADLQIRRAKTEQAWNILTEFDSHVQEVEDRLKNLLADDDAIHSRFVFVRVALDNLLAAMEANIHEGVPIDPDDVTQTG